MEANKYKGEHYSLGCSSSVETTAVDPHSFFADPDPAVLLNAESGSSFKKLTYEEFSGVEKDRKGYSKAKNYGAGPNLLNFFYIWNHNYCIKCGSLRIRIHSNN